MFIIKMAMAMAMTIEAECSNAWLTERFLSKRTHTTSTRRIRPAIPDNVKTRRTLDAKILVDVNVSELRRQIKYERERYAEYVHGVEESAFQTVNEIINHIVRIDYKKIGVEITPDKSVKFTIIISDDLLLIIDKPLGDYSLHKYEVIFSLFVDKRLFLTNINSIFNLVRKVDKINQ